MPSQKGSKGKSRTSKSPTGTAAVRPDMSKKKTAKEAAKPAAKPAVSAARKRPAAAKSNGHAAPPATSARAAKGKPRPTAAPVRITPLEPPRAKARLREDANGTDVRHKERSTVHFQSRAASRRSDAKRSEIVLPPDYRPLDTEPFMNERHRLYFRNKLLAWKDEILRLNMETLKGLHDDSTQQADPADRATAETDRALELRARDRQRKLMNKIDAALARIEDGSYGYCEETGEPISLKRLDARPIATLSIEAQEKRERRERIFRDD
jgi:DnaK suppressor protein